MRARRRSTHGLGGHASLSGLHQPDSLVEHFLSLPRLRRRGITVGGSWNRLWRRSARSPRGRGQRRPRSAGDPHVVRGGLQPLSRRGSHRVAWTARTAKPVAAGHPRPACRSDRASAAGAQLRAAGRGAGQAGLSDLCQSRERWAQRVAGGPALFLADVCALWALPAGQPALAGAVRLPPLRAYGAHRRQRRGSDRRPRCRLRGGVGPSRPPAAGPPCATHDETPGQSRALGSLAAAESLG